jgi:hypothetical protein
MERRLFRRFFNLVNPLDKPFFRVVVLFNSQSLCHPFVSRKHHCVSPDEKVRIAKIQTSSTTFKIVSNIEPEF